MTTLTQTTMQGTWKTNSLPVSGVVQVMMTGAPLPATLTLTSTAGNRAIQISTDGINFYAPTLDTTNAAFINVSINSPILVAQFTGSQNDIWRVQ